MVHKDQHKPNSMKEEIYTAIIELQNEKASRLSVIDISPALLKILAEAMDG